MSSHTDAAPPNRERSEADHIATCGAHGLSSETHFRPVGIASEAGQVALERLVKVLALLAVNEAQRK
jgi:hypothetical protein